MLPSPFPPGPELAADRPSTQCSQSRHSRFPSRQSARPLAPAGPPWARARTKGYLLGKQNINKRLASRMTHNAVENSALISALQTDIKDASKWIALAESQSTSAASVQVLARAVETVPACPDLWERFVDAKIQIDRAQALDALRDALALFPTNTGLWHRMFALFPSPEAYTAALQHLDNTLVWPSYLQYLSESPGVSDDQRRSGFQHYCQFVGGDEPAVKELALRLVARGQPADAAALLESHACTAWDAWQPLVASTGASAELVESAVHALPHRDAELVPVAAQKWVERGEPARARAVLLRAVEHSSSLAAFCAVFRAACQFYEARIAALLPQKGSGATEVARMLAEFRNLLRKRPMYLSDTAVRECPHNVALWQARAELWKHQPHIAADVLETALSTVDPARASQGQVADLWTTYTRLLIANGSDVALARTMLTNALDTRLPTAAEKAKIHIALAELEADGCKDREAALRVLESALRSPALSANSELWTAYISTLVEAKSPAVLEAFSRCCALQAATMRIVLITAQSFPDASANQTVVFDKGVQMFPVPMALPLWKHYLAAAHRAGLSIHELRGLYGRALSSAEGHRRAQEELCIMYSRAEGQHPNGSRLLAKQVLGRSVPESKNAAAWHEFIVLHDDAAEKRPLFEQAIHALDDKDACKMALAMSRFEQDHGEQERARALYRYAAGLSEGLDDVRTSVVAEWRHFEEKIGNSAALHELATFINPSHSIQFVPSAETAP